MFYAAANQWGDVADARKMMKRKNVKKDPEFSRIDVKNKLHFFFVVDDRTHPETDIIYRKVEEMMKRIREEGYVPETEFVLLDVEEEERARAVSILPVNIACGDCHNAIK